MHTYVAIFLLTFSTLFVPLPEEAALLSAGYVARLGRASLVGAAAAAWLAVIAGDVMSYAVGRLLLSRFLKTSWGQKLLPEDRRVVAEQMVAASGARAIVVGRFLVGLRGFVYLAVGASHYPFAKFVVVDGAVGVAGVGALVTIGFLFGELHARVGRGVDFIVAAVLVVALFGPLLARAFVKRLTARAAPLRQ